MPKLNRLKFLPLIILWSLLTSCATAPPNVPVCENLTQHLSNDPVTGHLILKPSPQCFSQIGEAECGHCTMTMSGEQIYIGESSKHLLEGKPWSQVKRESVYVPAIESYAPLSAYIINSCKQLNCSDDVTKFKVKLDGLNVLGEATVTIP